MSKVVLRATQRFDDDNLECARIILSNPEEHAGLGVDWARQVLARLGKTEDQQLALPLESE